MRRNLRNAFISVMWAALMCVGARAQDDYEIQVYPGETVEARHTMVEFHTNFTFAGRSSVENGELPSNHALHETVEITHGVNDWFEVGWYIFTSARSGSGWKWVGDHIRPRVRAPERWHWPIGVSLSTEFGYTRPLFTADTWTWEIRPIVDKQAGKWYLAFNPTLEKSLRGPSQRKGFEFSPNAKIAYSIVPKIAVGVEYYGVLGPVGDLDPLREQQQQVMPTIDLNVSPKWELNFAVGVGMTHSTDHLLVKTIVGYRFQHFPRFWGK